MQKHYRFN